MHSEYSWPKKLRFCTNVVALYGLTLGFAWFAVHPVNTFGQVRTVAVTRASQQPHVPLKPKVTVISGKPVRLVIPDSGIDLPVDDGYYDSATDEWTLSGYHAQFAMISTLANNTNGNTFIYGHNNNYVFGALRHNTPTVGATALIYTDNGHVFAYSFDRADNLGPDDVNVLNYDGPPILTVQTCTGSLNEWRTMYRFNFSGIEQ